MRCYLALWASALAAASTSLTDNPYSVLPMPSSSPETCLSTTTATLTHDTYPAPPAASSGPVTTMPTPSASLTNSPYPVSPDSSSSLVTSLVTTTIYSQTTLMETYSAPCVQCCTRTYSCTPQVIRVTDTVTETVTATQHLVSTKLEYTTEFVTSTSTLTFETVRNDPWETVQYFISESLPLVVPNNGHKSAKTVFERCLPNSWRRRVRDDNHDRVDHHDGHQTSNSHRVIYHDKDGHGANRVIVAYNRARDSNTDTHHTVVATSISTAYQTTVSTLTTSFPVISEVTRLVTQVATITAPGNTVTDTISLPGETVTAPRETVTDTVSLPGNTVTATAPGVRVTDTISLPGEAITIPGNTVTLPGKQTTLSLPGETRTLPGKLVVSTYTKELPAQTVTVTKDGAVFTTAIPGENVVITVTATPAITTVTAPPESVTVTICPSPTGAMSPLSPDSNLTFGCKPGFVCSLPKPNGCKLWPGPPSKDFLCEYQLCIPSPPFKNVAWGQNETGYYPPSWGYFNLNPEAFGLSYDIFDYYVYEDVKDGHATTITTGNWKSQASLSEWPRSSTSATPAHFPPPYGSQRRRRKLHTFGKRDITPGICFDDCNNAFGIAQSVGKTDALCKAGTSFQTSWSQCTECITKNEKSTKTTIRDYVGPEFSQFLEYCAGNSPAATIASVIAPERIVSSQPAVGTASQGQTSRNGFALIGSTMPSSNGPTMDINTLAGTTVVESREPTSVRPDLTVRTSPAAVPSLAQTARSIGSASRSAYAVETETALATGAPSISVSEPGPSSGSGPGSNSASASASGPVSVSKSGTVSQSLSSPTAGGDRSSREINGGDATATLGSSGVTQTGGGPRSSSRGGVHSAPQGLDNAASSRVVTRTESPSIPAHPTVVSSTGSGMAIDCYMVVSLLTVAAIVL
ncbi:hypothetical protein DCS_00365 [Drechmeria coniospora]|uniref:Glycoprotein X n=1 Tax=Drechmeria coniospora TaxID=98403 RepID=A0A151GQ40_DRECN|nr:hypothetical protein DCS_00365 [Drechmeria coniospora]KYK59235.1 hypothetical protein DCS_00365 [Drechmeria coniospora]